MGLRGPEPQAGPAAVFRALTTVTGPACASITGSACACAVTAVPVPVGQWSAKRNRTWTEIWEGRKGGEGGRGEGATPIVKGGGGHLVPYCTLEQGVRRPGSYRTGSYLSNAMSSAKNGKTPNAV